MMRKTLVISFMIGLGLSATLLCGLAVSLAWLLVPPQRERYSTAAFSFELPPGWGCRQEGTESVCRLGKPPSDVVVILTMKYRSPKDTMTAYEEHLRSPLPAVGRPGNAELVSLRRTTIAGSEWVEGILRDSEVKNYDTTYLAGNTAEVAILFTMSVHQKFRERRAADLRDILQSLVVYQRPR